MVEAVVEYNYNASEPDELTIAKGDVIREIVKKSGGWWEGTLRDKRGMFPDNFVTLIQKEHKASVRQQHKQKALRQCRAIFSYNPAHDDELKLNFGDLIDVLCEVEEGWWKGRLGHFEGVFPSNFVEEIEKSSSSKEDLTSLTGETGTGTPNLPPKPTRIICQAKYPYDACNDDELSLKEGDRITLISKDGQDRGWWRGELRGRVGVFPDNFVVVLPAVDQNGSSHTGKDKKHSVDLCNTASARMSISPQVGNDEPKHTNVASQRKSLELKTDDHRIPPLPGKKPNVPKKSPSSTGNTSVLAGLKQKLVDRVDGVASSRLTSETKGEDGDVDFDQVERSAMLPDMRANRAKAPGRRPPSVVYRDAEQPNLVNGNDHSQAAPISVENDDDDDDKKQPKVREWEKHKAPWVDELKLLNQVKRPGDPPRLKPNESDTEPKQKSPSLQHEFSPVAVPVDMSKSMSALSSKLKPDIADKSLSPNIPIADKSPTNVPVLRTKPPAQPSTPARPQSIHVVESSRLSISPNSQPTTTPSPKPPVADKDPVKLTSSPRSSIDKKLEVVTMRQYLELQDRILQMEAKMSQQYQQMQGTIDELKAKLQVETDMRRLLQSELEKVAQCVTQV